MSTAARALIGVLAIAVAVALFLVLRDDDSDEGSPVVAPQATEPTATTADGSGDGNGKPDEPKPPAEPEVATIVIENGGPVGGVQELEFTAGERIQFVVESDVAEEVHFHGYEVAKEVAAGGTVAFDVPAEIEGVFEVELEHSVVPIAEITVNPA